MYNPTKTVEANMSSKKRCLTSLVTREKQSHSETLPAHWDCPSQQTLSAVAGEAEMGTHTLLVAWKILQRLWKQSGSFSKSQMQNCHITQKFYLEAFTQGKLKCIRTQYNTNVAVFVLGYLTIALLQQPKDGNSANVHQLIHNKCQ